MAATAERKLTGKHALAMLLGFFSLTFIANGFFLYFALTSFSGLSTNDPYQKGIDYNEALAAKEAQLARGWKTNLVIVETGVQEVLITMSLTDANGKVPAFTEIKAILRRPAVEGDDVALEFVRDGVALKAAAYAPKPGNWDLTVWLYTSDYDTPYRVEKRLWIK